MADVKQFILANGDEIVCEVVEWASDTDPDLVVRRAYKIVTVDDPVRGIRYFTLRPWMIYQSGDDIFNTVNSNHIIAEGNPHINIMRQYKDAMDEAEKDQEEFKERVEKLAEKLATASEEEIINKDSSSDNIVYFGKFDKDKLH